MAFDLDPDPEWDQHRDSVEDIVAALERLRERQVDTLTAAGPPIKPIIVLKIETYLQGQLYRSVALGDGVCDTWDQGNALGAVILARSIVETTAVVWAFKSSLEKAVQKESLQAISEIANEYLLHSRWKGWKDPLPEAPGIMTQIDKLDAEFLADRKGKIIRGSYEYLSEYAHPNWSGAVGLFGDLDTEHNRVDFSLARAMKRAVRDIISGTRMLEVIEYCIDKVEEMLPKIREISEGDRG